MDGRLCDMVSGADFPFRFLKVKNLAYQLHLLVGQALQCFPQFFEQIGFNHGVIYRL